MTNPSKPKQIVKGDTLLEKVINLCQRRALIFANSELYGGMTGFFDYGPAGIELKRNIEQSWWKNFVQDRADLVGIDGASITHPKVWKASGHVDAFNDPLVDCKKCNSRYRADHLVEDELKITVDGLSLEKVQNLIAKHKLTCPKCKGELTPARVFNLMFKTHAGPLQDESSATYLRPETAQLIFADFKIVQAASRKQLPFGIAQIGRAFRNEIAPRGFVFRCREFSQMEIEFFIHPKKLDNCPILTDELLNIETHVYTTKAQEEKKDHEKMTIGKALEKGLVQTKWHAYWIAESLRWFYSLGIKRENLRVRQHVETELSHYSNETWDVEYKYPWGWKELQGIANRTDFDLKQHEKHSGKDQSYFDAQTNEKIVPFVIEPSTGVERTFLTVLLDAFNENKSEKGSAIVLKLNPKLAPYKAAVFPLMKKEPLAQKAKEVFEILRKDFACDYDETGSIGKRYARHDEIGTPYCITIDFDSLEKNDATIRDRNSGKQERVKISEIKETLRKKLEG
ncbi:MAG: glycine--tRNA ligase [Candidatus Micrarchaeia archaeon]